MAENITELDTILDICLAKIKTEGWSIEDCLAHYPDHRDMLAQSLRVAVRLQEAQAITPSTQFTAEASERLKKRLQTSRRKPTLHKKPVLWTFSPRRWATLPAALGLFAALSACTTGVVYASDSASPGDPLYGIDRSVEQVRISVTRNPNQLLRLQVALTDERLEEAEDLTRRGDTEDLEVALNNYDQSVSDITQLAGMTGEQEEEALSQLVDQSLSKHQARLEVLLDKVPEQAQKGIERALEASSKGRDKALEAINKHGDDHPGQGPPDKEDKPGGGPPDKEDKPEKPDKPEDK
ncbi:MAG: hypothetical protein JXB30_15340 [Anaerolineae bacterium]|nr:hypothetical protein [Anaerolineae bacterium]